MATHSSTLAWKITGTAEPGGLQSMGSHRVGHDCSNLAAAASGLWISECMSGFLPGASHMLSLYAVATTSDQG